MIQGTIFSIEEFAIHDGPGIRTAVFFKGCPLRCVWCHNPEGISFEPQYLDQGSGKTLCGYQIGADELATAVLRNKEVLEMNDGGVTVTGGEPLAQPEFLFEFLRRVKPLHTAIETSGYAPPEVFREAVSLTDLVLFDMKLMNPEWHYKFTGVRNIRILENLSWLCAGKKEFILRIPLIPGINDSSENMLNILAFIRHPKYLIRIEFLPYHKTAGAKYAMIGKKYNPPFDTEAQPQIHNIFQEYNIQTLIL